jgi:hypothetical protein
MTAHGPSRSSSQTPQHAAHTREAVPRLALSIEESCESIGVGWDLWNEHIAPEIKTVRVGRRKLVPVSELQRWLDQNAHRLGV